MGMIRAVVFDLAGTTVNDPDGVGACLRASLAAVGVEVSREATNAVMGIPKPVAIRQLIGAGRPDLLERVGAIYADFEERMIRFYRKDASVFEVPGTGDVFRRLNSAGVRVAVDTGFARAVTAVLLDRLGWLRDGLVQASVTSDEVERGRPFPDMIHRLMEVLEISDPKSVAKVGDTPSDLQEGTAAGCGVVVGVTSGSHTRDELARHPHTHLVESVREVPALLGL